MEIEKNKLIKNYSLLPEKKGIFYFSDRSDRILYAKKSSNLQKTIKNLILKADSDKDILQLVSLTEIINWEITDNLFEAVQIEKSKILANDPEFNDKIRDYKDFVYLAIDFYRVPFFKILTSTIDQNYYYLGPFQNRFFLYDFLDIMLKMFKFPACESEEYPCDYFKNKICNGFCMQEKNNIINILHSAYLQENLDLIRQLENRYQKLLDDLKFLEAQKIEDSLNILKKYYYYLRFLHCTKQINIDFSEKGKKFFIKNGLIEKIQDADKNYSFPILNIEYKKNEYLAIEKNNLNEAWIVYQNILKNDPEYLEKIYQKSLIEI